MSLPIFQRTIVDSSGNIQPGASVAVRNETTGELVPIFADREGGTAKANPFLADSEGFATFYVEPGEYQVTATTTAGTITWSHVAIGDTALLQLAQPAGSTLVGFQQAGAGAVERSMQDKAREVVSVKDFGAIGDGVTDDTVAIQAAVNSGAKTVYFPNGNYLISSTIRQATNGYALRLVGANKHHAVLTASPSFSSGAPMVWLGNSNGHGNYRAQTSYLTFVGNDTCIGLRYHEAGTSEIVSCQFRDCAVGVDCPGVIGTQIQRCEFYNCATGVNMTRPSFGTPSGPDDTAVTAGPLALSNNVNKVSDCWLSGGSVGVHLEGGLTHIQGCTFQAVGNTATKSVVELFDANESLEYGGGPIVSNCWFESGTYFSAVHVKNTRKAVIRENFISLDGICEQGIYSDSTSTGTTIQNNSFLDRGSQTPAGGRTQNAVVYAEAAQTALINNHYAAFGSYTYDQLIKLNWETTSQNVVIEPGQNGNNGYGVFFGLTEIRTGATGGLQKNSKIAGPFNNFVSGQQIVDCSIDEVAFSAGSRFFSKAGVPTGGDAVYIGDVCIDRTNANLYIHVGAGTWKLVTRAA